MQNNNNVTRNRRNNRNNKRNDLITQLESRGFKVRVFHQIFQNPVENIYFRNMNSVNPYSELPDFLKSGNRRIMSNLTGKQRFAQSARGYTVARVVHNDGRTFVGRSICSSSDNFNRHTGAIKAIGRAAQKAGVHFNG